MTAISKKVLCFLSVLFILSIGFVPPLGADQTVFGPKTLKINGWHFHVSFHTFKADAPGEGVITITKQTPQKKIRRGVIRLNGRSIPIGTFLRGSDRVLEKDVPLKGRNRMMVFLLTGAPGASITIEIRQKGSISPPEATFTADPPSITLGESITLNSLFIKSLNS